MLVAIPYCKVEGNLKEKVFFKGVILNEIKLFYPLSVT